MKPRHSTSSNRIRARTKPIQADALAAIEWGQLSFVEEQLRRVVLGYNFDTFSFLFSMLRETSPSSAEILEVFQDLKIDSIGLAEEYHGSNCIGLSLILQQKLAECGVKTALIPAYGKYLITEAADEYAEIRTADLLGLVRGPHEIHDNFFLASGLTLDKPILVRQNYQVDSYGSHHTVTRVSENGFELVTVRPNGNELTRQFRFEEILNPDDSVQKNLLRCRTAYQLTRQFGDSHREGITFDFRSMTFKIEAAGQRLAMAASDFAGYLDGNVRQLESIFRTTHLAGNFGNLLQSLGAIRNQLLLPEIRAILGEL